ncbi:tRNA (5-methylaminomethyl-2-thiouridine)(34)-methyltransferase MnmD [Tropicimonas sediminicola]|uniref:tRNA U34 5-methylaminomethyl-2-thiouridine-forming methyltransferase MnmC n=1 Tax=Tropicimonas sediminicola TaxID=1031541 RepID=A0A239ITB5_9RHOB|nr:tRNA (5-methylaminomethyl-2-thiouridine)(34)-methyltransferase MnmD [Tropicimonas sediminicola]SNS95664.1 tRNA U34 5-methylaminomethyl-2-thiouridine-forming methyltransferase MnmC [Tropicimonas sediminicola]
MQQSDQKDGLIWRDGNVPVSARFDDPYYSLDDGLAETSHVFLDGNDLPARLWPGFQVAELGVGTGLNLLALADCAARAGVDGVRYVGFEAFPLEAGDLARALAPFSGLEAFREPLLAAWDPAGFESRIGPVSAVMIRGDARDTLPAWQGAADAWFLDGFAPARNPELWQDDLMAEVGRRTAPGGSFATYTAAGAVRRALAAAGFTVERRAGYGRKRHMSSGRMPA